MLTSTLYRHLFVTCLGLYAVQLCCAINSINIHHEQAERTMTHCLRNCSHLSKDLIETQLNAKVLQISSRQSCYEKCLQKIGKHDILGNQQRKPLFTRIKRDVSSPQAKSKQSNESNGLCRNYTGKEDYLRGLNAKKYITVFFYNTTGRMCANISWNPPPETANWTGYRLIYATEENGVWNQVNCIDVKKNVTSIIVPYDWKGYARLQITSLPPMNIGDEGYGYTRHSVKKYYVKITTVATGQPCTATSPYTRQNRTTPTTSPYSTKITNKTDEQTNLPSNPAYSTKITNKTDEQTNLPSNPVSITLLVSTTASVAIILIIVAAVVFWYLRRSRLNTSTSYVDTELMKEGEWKFDAFIIYSSEDEKWVEKTLLSTLEKKHGFKCCIHYRDFVIGRAFRENMVDSVYMSRKTVAVVSRSFLKSKYCNKEMDFALHRLLERSDDSVVVIKLDDVDRERLPRALQERSYIDYPKSIKKKAWEKKLVDCLKVSV